MKHSMFSKQVQKGFTLLELLVVVAIIAILSVGAIFAYDGLTESAQEATGSNNLASTDQAIRNYKVVTGNFPNQFDHLLTDVGDNLDFVSDDTYEALARVPLTGGTQFYSNIVEVLEESGIEELMIRTSSALTAGVEPNLQHNEGADPLNATEIEIEDGDLPSHLVILPTATSAICSVGGAAVTTNLDGGTLVTADVKNRQVTINDALGEDECHLYAVFGFGHDAAQSTSTSNAAIAYAPAYVSEEINPATTYARYLAVFDLGFDADEDDAITDAEIYKSARFLGLLTPEGEIIEEKRASALSGGEISATDFQQN